MASCFITPDQGHGSFQRSPRGGGGLLVAFLDFASSFDSRSKANTGERLVEMELMSNDAGREQYLYQSRIHMILAPAIQDVCKMTPALTKFVSRININSQGALPRHGRHPTRPILRCPANITTTWPTTPHTPPRGYFSGASSGYVPNLVQIRSHRLPRIYPSPDRGTLWWTSHRD